MKITLDLDGEYLLAFQRAFAAARLPAGFHRHFAHQLVLMGADAFAVSDRQPCVGPVGRLEWRLWTEEERAAHYAMHRARRAEEPAPVG